MSFNSKYTGQEVENLLDQVAQGGGSSSGGGGAYAEVKHGTNDTTFTLTPNTFHIWDEVSALTLNLGSETNGVANEFLFQFSSGATATTLTLPDDIKWANDSAPTIAENMIYQVSILKGLASALEFDNAIPMKVIDFYIIGWSCQAEEGMIWSEWMNSDYKTINVELIDNIVSFGGMYLQLNGVNVSPNDVIVEGVRYMQIMDLEV